MSSSATETSESALAGAATSATTESRRDRKKARTRGSIYDAAMALFAERGVDAVTLSEICQAADVGRGTFFLHFPSKAALLYEFNQRVADDFAATLVEPRASARDELTSLVDRMAGELAAQAEIMVAMLREFFGSPEALAAMNEHGEALPELVGEIMARGQQRGEFARGVLPALAAASFLTTAAAIISGQVFESENASREEIRRQFLQLTFSGLSVAGDSVDAD
jgi:AcrR family transcriptional regulator